jgi:hypothetical protein
MDGFFRHGQASIRPSAEPACVADYVALRDGFNLPLNFVKKYKLFFGKKNKRLANKRWRFAPVALQRTMESALRRHICDLGFNGS